MKRIRPRALTRLLLISAFTPLLLLSSQNCTSSKDFRASSEASNNVAGGNGDGYSGVIVTYDHTNTASPCVVLKANGQPLPNDTILASGNKYSQVRAQCQDIAAVSIEASQVSISSDTHLHFAGFDFVPHSPVTFETIAEACPAGKAPLANPVRNNLFGSPLNLSVSPWGTLPGMTTYQENAIADLVSTRVERAVDATSTPYLRTDQFLNLSGGTSYAISFLAKSGSSRSLRLELYTSDNVTTDSLFVWDLTTGALTQSVPQLFTNVSTTSRPFASGYFITLYFTVPAGLPNLDIGVSPGDLTAGQYIYVSEAQFEPVSNYCSP